MSPDEAYPAQLAARLRAAGLDYEVVNAGVSGDTSAGGLRRLEWSMAGDVRVLVVALGANDGLRGLPPKDLRANLARIIETAQARQVRVVLAGMEAPPNFGAAYTRDFRAVYRELATDLRVTLIPVLPRRRRRRAGAQPGRRHPPDGRRPAHRGGHHLARRGAAGRRARVFLIHP